MNERTTRYANGDVHYGEWFNGKKQGKGVLVVKGKRCNVFNGFWSEDAREGLGTIFWTDSGYKYVGEWVKDQVRCGEVKPARREEVVDALSNLPESILGEVLNSIPKLRDLFEMENSLPHDAAGSESLRSTFSGTTNGLTLGKGLQGGLGRKSCIYSPSTSISDL